MNSASSNFIMNPFVVDGIKVNIYGTIENKKTYPETGSFTISFEELMPFNTVDWIENRVVQFIQLLKMEKDFAFNEISFFGKIKIVNNTVKTLPIYFILAQRKYTLYKMDEHDVSQLNLLFEDSKFDNVVSHLKRLDSKAVKDYYEWDEKVEVRI